MIIDPEKLTAFISSAQFDWKDKKDPLTQSAEEAFGEIIKPVYIVDGNTIYICKGKK